MPIGGSLLKAKAKKAKPLRILVCGANYGRSYLQALRGQPGFELAGILARGSSRSLSVAQSYKVPLWRTVADLPHSVDLACVALPSKASDVVLDLLRRRISVLCEHPQSPEFLKRAFQIARSTGTKFHLNAHFGDLPAPQSFLHSCAQILRRGRPALVSITAADRALFAALDILRRAFGSLEFRGRSAESSGSFSVMRGSLAHVPALFAIQRARVRAAVLADADPSYLADMRLSVVFSSGILSLQSVAGPVVWNANYARSGKGVDQLWKVLSPNKPVNATALQRLRIAANAYATAALARSVDTGRSPAEQSRQHLLDVSRSWERVRQLLRR